VDVLRNHVFVQRLDPQPWWKFQSVIVKQGQCVWLGKQQLTAEHAYPVNLLAYWQIGEEEPWFLATNLPTQPATFRAYR
jgi:hypothetical protein